MLMRPYGSWVSPWRDLQRLRREMNRVLADWPAQPGWASAPSYPAMNVWMDEDHAVVTAELPGIKHDSIDISVEEDTLTLRGDRQPDNVDEGVVLHRRERRYGPFVRTFRLPFRVDAEHVEATFARGVLSISLPRADADKPKKIAIKAG